LSTVLDASAVAPILIADEHGDLLPGLTDKLAIGVVVPGHWRIEVVNLLLSAVRRGRLTDADLADAIATWDSILVTVDEETDDKLSGSTWQLASRHQLSIYDAAYLELALRRHLPLATNDRALMRASAAEAVALFGR
jgi:predicted nucleic acid-binding protein